MTAKGSLPEEVGFRLRQLRMQKSQKEFASELGIAERDYAAYETGKREIPASLLVTLMQRCAVDPAWMLTGKRFGTIRESAATATIAYQAILEAAQRADVTLAPEVFAYAITAALPAVARGGTVDEAHADVLVKLATISPERVQSLREAQDFLSRNSFDWNIVYMATTEPQRAYSGHLVGVQRENFMMRADSDILIGWTEDLPRPIPESGASISFETGLRQEDQSRSRDAHSHGRDIDPGPSFGMD